jgi:hypothetical protein
MAFLTYLLMKKILHDYIRFIRTFEDLLKEKYNFHENPCQVAGMIFERIGSINGIEYWFHGTGCTAKLNNVIYRYDISLFEKDEIHFSIWEFQEFLRTHEIYSKANYSSEFVESELEKLVTDQTLAWLTIMDRVYKVYRVLQ